MPPRGSSATFVGRSGELSELEAALGRARDGTAAMVLVGGESGIGKTRLVSEFSDRAAEGGARVLVGECVDLGSGELPYAPVVAALRRLPHVLDAAELEAVLGAARDDLSLLVPELAGGGAAAPRGPAPEQALLFEQLLGVLARLGQRAPLVLVVEDLHWADPSTRQLLAFLVRNARDERLLVVGTYRTEELHRRHPLRPFLAEADRAPHVDRLALAAFTHAELTQQLAALLGEAPDAGLADDLFARAEGNPFFTEELLAATQGDHARGLPDNIRDALLLRIEELDETTQQVLRVAAAAGPRASHGLLAAAATVPEEALHAGLREALAHNVLVRDESGDGYAFRHALLREAIYDDLLPGERGPLHRTLARALQADPSLSATFGGAAAELAFHWLAAHDLPAALAASLQAAEDAGRMSAVAAASAHFERAIELWDGVAEEARPQGVTLADVLRSAVEAAHLTGDYDRAAALARRALAEIDADAEPGAAALLEERIGLFRLRAGRAEEALASYRSGAARLPVDVPTPERATLLVSEGHALMLTGRMDEAIARGEEALEIVRAVGPPALEASILVNVAPAMIVTGRGEEGLAAFERATELAREAGDDELLVRCSINHSEMLDQLGRTREAAEVASEGAAHAARGRITAAVLLGDAAWRLLKQGRVDEAEALLDPLHAGRTAGSVLESRGFIAMVRGDWTRADAILDEAARDVDDASTAMWQVWQAPVAVMRAEAALWRGDPDAALARLSRALAGVGDVADPFYIAPLFAVAARAHADAAVAARGMRDGERASTAARAAKDLAADLHARLDVRFNPPEAERHARVCALEARRAAGEDDAAGWAEAAADWEAFERPYLAAYARWREAEAALSSGNDRSTAQAALARAVWVLGGSPAAPLLHEIEGLAQRGRLRLAEKEGAAPPSEQSTAERIGLTARELEVLRLVAAGRTNKEIAGELFISDKTASVHVSRILSKLDVRGRVEAASLAHRLGLTEPGAD
jgi:ATP/maltotriose-dependent transcriptional regulator MalT